MFVGYAVGRRKERRLLAAFYLAHSGCVQFSPATIRQGNGRVCLKPSLGTRCQSDNVEELE
jgi:hypothetical protein